MGTSMFEVLNKKRLEHITMHEDKIWARTDLNINVFIWEIKDKLDSLDDNEENEENEENCIWYAHKTGWLFTVTKTDSFYDIEIDTAQSPYFGEMRLRVNFGGKLYSRLFNLTRRYIFVYKVEVPIEVVHTPERKFESFDFIFHESSNLFYVTIDKPLAEVCRSSKEMPPFKDLLKSSRFSICTDLVIQAEFKDEPAAFFRAHRSILAARNHVFREKIRKSFSVKTTEPLHEVARAGAMEAFLSYIYTGLPTSDLHELHLHHLESALKDNKDYKSLIKLLVAYGIPRIRYRARFYSSKDTRFSKYVS